MKKSVLSDKFIDAMAEKAKNSDKRLEIEKYISEVAERCAELCKIGESLRVLNEYKIMIDNLKAELEI